MTGSGLRPFLVIGPGAVGTYLGGSLALHGFPVVWLVLPRHRERLKARGLRLHLPFGEFLLPAGPVYDAWDRALEAFPDAQGVLLAVKAYHLDAVLERLHPLRERLPPVLSLLNGVETERPLVAMLGSDRVLVGSLLTAVEREGIGHVRVARLRGLALEGRVPRPWVRAFEAARVHPRVYPSARSIQWSKLLTNLLANSLSALLDWSPAQVYTHPALCRLEVAQQREALQVMRALGVPVIDLPRTPVRGLAWVVEHLPPGLACRALRPFVAGGRGSKMPSFHRDLWQGPGRTEADAYHGPVVRYGERAGVPTPVHRALWRLWQAVHRGELDPQGWRHRPEALLHQLQALGMEVQG